MTRIRTPDGTRYELYDLATDPGEKTNIYEKLKKPFGFRRARIDRYLEFRSNRRNELAHQTKGVLPVEDAATIGLDPKITDKLRGLGYVE
jgi:hypothetical protein